LFVLHPRIRAWQPAWMFESPEFWKRLTLWGWLALLAIGFAVPTWVTGQELANRVLGSVYLVFLLGWFVVLFVFTRRADTAVAPPTSPRPVLSLAMLLFSLSVAATGNTRTALYDLVHRAPPWRHSLEQRYRLIRSAVAQGSSDVVVPRPPLRPATFFQGPADITADGSDWKNTCLANFFDVASVRYLDEGK
jgi:hypothetical protein